MSYNDLPEASLRLTLDVAATITEMEGQTETEDHRHETEKERPFVTEKRQVETNITATETVEGNEAVAERLVELFEQRDAELVNNMLGEYVEQREAGWGGITHQNAELDLFLSNGAIPVYLAARKMAAEKTKTNMIRQGYSTEKVLTSWMCRGGFGYPNEDSIIDMPDSFAQSARYALFTWCVDQTPGGDIDTDVIPDRDEWMDVDRGKDLYD